jgi:hypothetical protein
MKYWQKARNLDIFGIDKSDTERSKYWKLDILMANDFDPNKSLIDVGCGDMFFWGNLPLKEFTGVDRDCQKIAHNRKIYPTYRFCCERANEYLGLSADTVVCFDWLNHIMDDADYVNSISNLTKYANNKIFIYVWYKNPFKSFINKLIIKKPLQRNVVTDSKYQYYRDFKRTSQFTIEKYFKLQKTYTNDRWPYGAMFYYEREK